MIKKRGINAKITGVEIWKNYRNQKWECYDEIVIEDIRDYLKKVKKKYDIVLLIDVLEHFSQEDGIQVLKSLIKITKKLLVVSTPVRKYPQGSWRGNPHEEHKYIWSEKKLSTFGLKNIYSAWIPTFTFWPPITKLGIYVLER